MQIYSNLEEPPLKSALFGFVIKLTPAIFISEQLRKLHQTLAHPFFPVPPARNTTSRSIEPKF